MSQPLYDKLNLSYFGIDEYSFRDRICIICHNENEIYRTFERHDLLSLLMSMNKTKTINILRDSGLPIDKISVNICNKCLGS